MVLRMLLLPLLVLAIVVGSAKVLPAQGREEGRARPARKEAAKKEPVKRDTVKKEAATIAPERETAVTEFVRQHHPELADLLRHLKDNKPRQYERAMRDLAAASERLSNLERSDSDRYDLELRAWKLKSRIQLLTAKLTMKDDEELAKELKAALADQYDVRREMLVLEARRTGNRLKKLEKDLVDHDARREAALEKQFQQLTSAPKARPAKSPGPSKTTGPAKSKIEKKKPVRETTGR